MSAPSQHAQRPAPWPIALYEKAFARLRAAAAHGGDAEALLLKAHAHWTGIAAQE
ncbi:hypothetical protein [Streptomyces sp. NPDC092952]|uniref:hypothetical protein n=1 Tax=Streptomyces sp. NPDC092952 TaxID=3366018 RepID=UPI003802EF06